MSEWSKLADSMKSSAMKADLGFSIAELEVALETAVINEPINRAEGLVEQADLELQHAASYREALGLLQSGKALPTNLLSEIKSCLKGGPGSGPQGGKSSLDKSKEERQKGDDLRTKILDSGKGTEHPDYPKMLAHYDKADEHMQNHMQEQTGEKETREQAMERIWGVSRPDAGYNPTPPSMRTHISDSAFRTKKSIKGGPGSGPHRSGVQSEGQKASERAARFTKIAEATGKSSDHLAAYGAHLNAAKANEGTDKGFRHQAAAGYHSEQFSQERAGEKDLEANAKNDFVSTHALFHDKIYA